MQAETSLWYDYRVADISTQHRMKLIESLRSLMRGLSAGTAVNRSASLLGRGEGHVLAFTGQPVGSNGFAPFREAISTSLRLPLWPAVHTREPGVKGCPPTFNREFPYFILAGIHPGARHDETKNHLPTVRTIRSSRSGG